MRKQPFYSIIMPVYNAGEYLRDAIQSILDQSFEDFELILVNDGSQDGSDAICRDFQRRDTRIVYLEQKNQGISCARNRGMETACGKWLGFCDHDDLYMPEILKEQYKILANHHVDFIKYGRRLVLDSGKVIETEPISDAVETYRKNDLKKYYMRFTRAPYMLYVWDCFFRASFLKNNSIVFDPAIKAGEEDRVFMFECVSRCESFILDPKVFYTHFARKGQSATSKFSMNRCRAIEKSWNREERLIKELIPAEEAEEILKNRMTYYIDLLEDQISMDFSGSVEDRERFNIIVQFWKQCDCTELLPNIGNGRFRDVEYALFRHKLWGPAYIVWRMAEFKRYMLIRREKRT